jgi:hypothetical protein
MKNLKYLIPLKSKVSIYVPSTNNVNEAVDNSTQVDYVMSKLSEMFGGATSAPAMGAWVSESGQLVKENVTIVYAFCTDDKLNKCIDYILQVCERIKKEMS